MSFRAAEFSGVSAGLPVGAIPGCRCRGTYEHGEQRDRVRAKGCRDRIHQTQGSFEVAGSRSAFANFAAYVLSATRQESGYEMNSEKFAGILGAIVAIAVLALAIAYGPIGQFGKSQKSVQKTEQPAQPVSPAPRGPVIREVPQ